MSEPIKIVVTAETQQAAAELKNFLDQQKLGFKEVSAAAHGASSALGSNRMAMMELGHVGRSMADGLVAGISPLRMLAMESPRILQAASSLGIGFAAMLPYILGVGAAVGAGYLGWKAYMSGVEDTTKELDDLVAALDKVPALLDKISERRKAGLISNAKAKELNANLKNPPKLYRDENNQLTTSPTHQEDIKPDIDFGPAPDRGWKQRTVENTPLTDAQNLAEAMKQAQAVVNQTSEAQTQAVNKLKDLQEKIHEETLTGIDREIAKRHEQSEKEIADVRAAAEASGNLVGEKSYADATGPLIEQIKLNEQRDIGIIKSKAQAESDAKDLELQKSYNAYLAECDALENDIAAEERKQREEAERRLALQQEINRQSIQAKLENINADPYLTDDQKAARSIPLYQKQIEDSSKYIASQNDQLNSSTDETAQIAIREKIAKATADQATAEQKLREAQAQGSWQSAYAKNLVALQNAWQNISVSLTNGAFQLIQQGVSGIATALRNVVMGTQSAAQAFSQFATSLISNFIEMVVEAILWAKIAIPILTYLGVVSGGTTAAAGAAVTIASIASAMAMAAPFAEGGRPVPGEIALIGERGPELWVPDSAGTIIPNHLLADAKYNSSSQNKSAAINGSAGGGSLPPKVIIVNDRQAVLNIMKSSDGGHITVVHMTDPVNKRKAGLPT